MWWLLIIVLLAACALGYSVWQARRDEGKFTPWRPSGHSAADSGVIGPGIGWGGGAGDSWGGGDCDSGGSGGDGGSC